MLLAKEGKREGIIPTILSEGWELQLLFGQILSRMGKTLIGPLELLAP